MKACVFYYDGFCDFEMIHTACALRQYTFTAALEDRVYISEENQKHIPDITLDKVDPNEVDIFLLTGGDFGVLYKETALKDFLCKLNEKHKLIAAICGGAEVLAHFGLLDGKNANGGYRGFAVDENNKHIYSKVNIVKQNVVRDGNIITSIGMAYHEFCTEVCKAVGVEE